MAGPVIRVSTLRIKGQGWGGKTESVADAVSSG